MPKSKVAKVESKPQPKPEPLNDEAMKGIWVDGIGLHIGADYVILEGTIGKPRTEKNYVVSRIMFPTRILEQISEKTSFRQISIDISDFLTSSEIDDLETSLKEIEEGKAKKFKNVNEFLEELKH